MTFKADEPTAAQVYRKVDRRLIPLMLGAYTLACLDRINIGFAQAPMQTALGFDLAVYGTAASIFFVGYFLFEIPSNLVMKRFGARVTLPRIMMFWGLASACTALVDRPAELYILRFILGVFEAGLFPGLILYMTYWYPPARRARVTGLVQLGMMFAGMLGGPVSGIILRSAHGVAGLDGWQWMFILEGAPSFLFAFVLLAFLCDGPDKAPWLDRDERRIIAEEVGPAPKAAKATAWREVLSAPALLFALLYFIIAVAIYAAMFWLPVVLHERGIADPVTRGWAVAVPYLVAACVLIVGSWHSDHKQERRWHFIGSALAIATGFILLAWSSDVYLAVLCFSIIIGGAALASSIFWSMATTLFGRDTAAAGIAFINCMGLLGGAASPLFLGYMSRTFGGAESSFTIVGLAALAMGWLMARSSRGMRPL